MRPALRMVMLCNGCLVSSRPLGGMAGPGIVLLMLHLVVGLLGSARARPHAMFRGSAAQRRMCCISIIALGLVILLLISLPPR